MRQIQICAWLLLTLTACGGEEFLPGGSSKTSTHDGQGGSSAAGARQNPDDAANNGGGASNDPEANGGSRAIGAAAGSGGTTSRGMSGAGGPSAAGAAGHGSAGFDSGGAVASADCASGAITFRMLPGSSLAPDYLCDAGCGTGWLSISDAAGAVGFSIFSACGAASCDSCEVQTCAAAACLATPLTREGSELVWRGSYLEKDKCGQSNLVCQQRACMKPGKYKARACAAINGGPSGSGGCLPKDEQLCAEAEFEFPDTKTVKLVLGE
jgi:hypothetical protein